MLGYRGLRDRQCQKEGTDSLPSPHGTVPAGLIIAITARSINTYSPWTVGATVPRRGPVHSCPHSGRHRSLSSYMPLFARADGAPHPMTFLNWACGASTTCQHHCL